MGIFRLIFLVFLGYIIMRVIRLAIRVLTPHPPAGPQAPRGPADAPPRESPYGNAKIVDADYEEIPKK